MQKSNPKGGSRERLEAGRSAVAAVPSYSTGAGSFAEATAIATAAGIATLGVLRASEAHASPGNDATSGTGIFPMGDGHHSASEKDTVDQAGVNQGSDLSHVFADGKAHAGDGQGNLDLSTQQSLPADGVPESEAQPVVATMSREDGSGQLISHQPIASELQTETPGISGVTPQSHDEVVSRLADHIGSTIENVLSAIQQGSVDGAGQILAQDIFQTAGNIVQDIRAQITSVASIDTIAAPVQDTLHGAIDDISGLGQQISGAVSGVDVMDALTGVVDVGSELSSSVHGLVGELSGITNAVIPDITANVADIPASVLGGTDGGHGILADIFYDDGGSQTVSGIASQIAHAAEPADLGFLGQPLSVAEELTGIFHGSSALHLV